MYGLKQEEMLLKTLRSDHSPSFSQQPSLFLPSLLVYSQSPLHQLGLSEECRIICFPYTCLRELPFKFFFSYSTAILVMQKYFFYVHTPSIFPRSENRGQLSLHFSNGQASVIVTVCILVFNQK